MMISFFLELLSKDDKYSRILHNQWRYALIQGDYGSEELNIDKYMKLIDRVKKSLHLTDEQEKFYFEWFEKETEDRVDAIVSNKYRGNYDKAARIWVAMAKTLANQGMCKQDVNL